MKLANSAVNVSDADLSLHRIAPGQFSIQQKRPLKLHWKECSALEAMGISMVINMMYFICFTSGADVSYQIIQWGELSGTRVYIPSAQERRRFVAC